MSGRWLHGCGHSIHARLHAGKHSAGNHCGLDYVDYTNSYEEPAHGGSERIRILHRHPSHKLRLNRQNRIAGRRARVRRLIRLTGRSRIDDPAARETMHPLQEVKTFRTIGAVWTLAR